MKTRTTRTEQWPKIRLVSEDAYSRIERVAFSPTDAWYEVTVNGVPYGSAPTQFEAETKRDGIVADLLERRPDLLAA